MVANLDFKSIHHEQSANFQTQLDGRILEILSADLPADFCRIIAMREWAWHMKKKKIMVIQCVRDARV